MKKTFAIVFAFMALFVFNGCLSLRVVNGDGDIINQAIDLTDFEKISCGGSNIELVYVQSADPSVLNVSTDRNIFDLYRFEVVDSILIIEPEKEYRNVVFKPTQFHIHANSVALKKMEVAGKVNASVKGPYKGEDLYLELAGSGSLNLNDSVMLNRLRVELAGSATLNTALLQVDSFHGEIAGSGTLNLGGKADQVKVEIAGSGKVRALPCEIRELDCDVAGSGNIEAYVTERIHADVAGSGKIRYKGDPVISKSIAGSGSVKKLEE